ncbi:SGNH/GDSL hydrolase family protein [Arthrobacter sp. IA7]|uniref:SGNH/GDSL hydrolase family protein n=1 Tax=Arthrobacter ipis TaxID=2716202 RepID=UPI001685E03F|nr:SGNH/GDSL hydrolase family protein [Arthrobacter ipis]MBD1541845.1 SGNH/GDSL hydrolase family protein [Arthrobacter ipis]
MADTRLQKRSIPGLAAIPGVMTSPPTISAAAATQLTSAATIPPWQPGAYTFSGGKPSRGASFPDDTSFGVAGMYTNTSATPWVAECDLDLAEATGRFEVQVKPNASAGVRIGISINGAPMQYMANGPSIMDGTNQFHLVTMGAPGRYRMRLELDGNARFYGISVALTDTVRSVRQAGKRMVVVGDSYTEPTIVDSNPRVGNMGWVQRLGMMLGVSAISCGSGGTGYVNPGAGGRVKFRDRSADWLGQLSTGDILVFAGGINDTSYTAAQVGTEAAACFALCPPGVELVVLSPFWPRGFQSYSANLLAVRDAIKTAAVAAGAKYIDLLQIPAVETLPAATTLAAATTGTPSQISTVANIPNGTYIQIGTDTNAEIRMTTGRSGSGPYTLSFGGSYNGLTGGGNLARTHALGDPVIPSGPGYMTGTGKQGTTVGDGNADRYTGSDATHPSGPGHFNIATYVLRYYTETLEG